MNIQDKMQEIHHKYGVTEMANYKIQLFVEALLNKQKEQLTLTDVSQQRELLVCGCGKNKPVTREPAYIHCDWCDRTYIEKN